MITTKQVRRKARELYKLSLVDDALDENRIKTIVNELLEKKPRGYLAILKYFQRLIRLHIEKYTARIETAIQLDEETKNKIQQGLIQRYGNKLRFEYIVNPSLIGGMRLKIGSNVYDASILGKLNVLKEEF